MLTPHVTGWKSLLLTGVVSALLVAAPLSDAAAAQRRGGGRGRQDGTSSRPGAVARDMPRGYREPVFARGYDDGYGRGLADGRRGARYDPVESRDYRNGDRGYANGYGPREAYRTNYRTGFRQGYEDGYRDGTR
ncbi:MAG: hypothetical protein A3I61_11745 [Acidobacteria bacterium RIFCSPLOWO2_02_FULL_68_18]|nr:MAG: hypothetical protein A3I61_11745 [Acidobacteria bacterium RIFCSPLOWO2_02_FULL_68_18]